MPDPDVKHLALQACDNALVAGVQTAITNLLLTLAQAQTADDRQQALVRHRAGLQLCKDVHAASLGVIGEVFAGAAPRSSRTAKPKRAPRG